MSFLSQEEIAAELDAVKYALDDPISKLMGKFSEWPDTAIMQYKEWLTQELEREMQK